MILGMSLETFTLLHVVISLIAIVTGFVVVIGMIDGKSLPAWTALFLLTTVMTSVTGFMFPFSGVTPGIVVGASQRSSGISARPTRVGDHRRAAAGDSFGMKDSNWSGGRRDCPADRAPTR
jgi:hypothetical protein